MRRSRLDDPNRRVEVIRRDVEDGSARLLSAGVADHDIQAAKSLDGPIDQFPAKRLVPDIAWDSDSNSSFGLDQVDDFFRIGLFAGEVVNRDIGTFSRVGDSGRSTHAGIASGDELLAARQPTRALVAGLAMVGPGIHLARETGPWLGLLLVRRLGVFIDRIPQLLFAHHFISLPDRRSQRSGSARRD